MVGLLRLAAVLHQAGADPVDVHVLGAPRLADRPHLLAHHGVPPGRSVRPAVLDGPVLRQPAALGHPPAELAREGRLPVTARAVLRDIVPVARQDRCEERADLVAVARVVFRPVELQRRLRFEWQHEMAGSGLVGGICDGASEVRSTQANDARIYPRSVSVQSLGGYTRRRRNSPVMIGDQDSRGRDMEGVRERHKGE